jgi:transcriptional regulator with XRE-family HTH domain
MTGPYPHPLIAQLADERRRRGLSQVAAANRAGIAVSSLNAWEAGALPNLAALQCYLDGLGLRIVAIPAEAPTPVWRPPGQQIPFGQLTVGDGEKWCPDCEQVRAVTGWRGGAGSARRSGISGARSTPTANSGRSRDVTPWAGAHRSRGPRG